MTFWRNNNKMYAIIEDIKNIFTNIKGVELARTNRSTKKERNINQHKNYDFYELMYNLSKGQTLIVDKCSDN